VQVSRQFGRVEALASTIDTQGTGALHVPAVVDAETAALIAESGAYSETEDTFSEVVLDAYKYGSLAKASDEMVADTGVDLAGLVAARAGQAIALGLNPHLVNGTGTGQPRGITANTTGVTLSAGQTTTITSADSFIDLFHSVSPAYRDNATWLLHDTTFKLARKLKDSTNQYILQPGLQAGAPDLILGRAAYADPDMPTPAANAKTVYFGDIKSNYLVRNAGPVTVKVLTDLYSANGLVGFGVDRRVDGDIIDSGAARVLIQSAT
jgi:HK97 family phage major capsid protein